jgi:signal transduction histidine kinase
MFSQSASREERTMQAGRQTTAGEEFIRRVVAALPMAAALFDAGREDFRCVAANAAFSRRLGLGRNLVIGRPLRELLDGSQQERVLAVLGDVCSSGVGASLVVGAEAGPEERPAVTTFDVLPVRAVASRVTDILMVSAQRAEPAMAGEEAREASRLRERARHLEELERAKSEFLNLASHELRGPAATLRGYLSMLEEGTLGPLPEGLREVLPVLQAKASQINMLASEMIEASRLEEGMRLNREPVDMRELLTRLVANIQAIAPNHRLVIHDRSPQPVLVNGDRMRLEIVVNNLLDNAVKYSPGGGEIYCDLSAVKGMMLLAIRDTGIGIAAEDMPRLFVRFSRLATEQMPDVPGTGLGLYLARELARLHGGDITAVSGPGEGSEFTLSLPVDASASA